MTTGDRYLVDPVPTKIKTIIVITFIYLARDGVSMSHYVLSEKP